MVVGVTTNTGIVEEKRKVGGSPLGYEIGISFVPLGNSLESATVRRSFEKTCLVREQEP